MFTRLGEKSSFNVYKSFKKFVFFCIIFLNFIEVFIICVTPFETKSNLAAHIFSNKAAVLNAFKGSFQMMFYSSIICL